MVVPWFDRAEAQSLCRGFVEAIGARVYPGPDYRATLLTNKAAEDWIEPFVRCERGQAQPLTGVHLRLRKGIPVAGLAWEKPMRAFILELPEFHDVDEVLKFYVEEVRVPADQADALRRGTMKSYRSILCVGLHQDEREWPLVLSVDSVLPRAFVNDVGGDAYVKWGGKLVSEIKRISPQMRSVLTKEEVS